MVNLLAAILISAAVGFLAGHFSARDNDPAPVSLKEAVTGEIDAPPAQFNLPRPPRAAKPPPKSAPVMCEQGKTLQEQIAQLKFVEMNGICREAERNWQKQNIEEYAPHPLSTERDAAVRALFDLVKDSFVASERWRGELSLAQGDRNIEIEFFTTFSNNRPGAGPITDPRDLCISISTFFVINGKGMPTGSLSVCGGALRRRGDGYYILWETHNDELLSPVMLALLIPVPGAPGTLEYLNSQSGTWVKDSRFQWRAATSEEIVEAAERHSKKVEDKGR